MLKSLNFKSWKGVAAGIALGAFLAVPAIYAQSPNVTQQSPAAAVESAVVSPSVSPVPRAVTSRVKSVSMFKNGVALVREEFTAPASGQYALDAIPYAIHGAFFIQSTANVEAVLTQRQYQELAGASGDLNYQKDLVGKKVRVFFNNANLPPVHGTVAAVRQPVQESTPQSVSDFQPRNYYSQAYYSSRRDSFETANASSPFLILDTDFGQSVIQQSSIARVDVEGEIGAVVRSRPTLLFKVKTEKPAVVSITYLTKGAAWAPAYRILLPDEKSNRGKMSIEQTATIVNQWRSFSDAQLYLISGYPKIGCENVISPISNKANLSAFFSQMLRPDGDDRGSMMSQMVMNSVSPRDSDDFPSGSVAASGDGPDIYYHPVGQRSMNKADVLTLSNGKKETEFERIVEWTVADTRNENGHPLDRENPNTPWDTIQFVNPFDFPMTTGPAAVMTEHKFLGQNTSYWTSPGEKTSIPITKSLSVSVKADEQEINRSDEMRYMGVRCRRITVAVELSIANRRAEPIKALVKRQFSGEIEKPVEGAKVVQLNQYLNALNRQNELRWELTLNPGETRTLKYEYEVYMSY